MPAEKKDKKKEDVAPTVAVGTYIFSNGDKYEGDYIHSDDNSIERSGTGTHTSADGTVYNGMWSGDKMNGEGTLRHPSGAVYEGNFVNNQFNGSGKYSWANGSFYEGRFVENRMEGQGCFTDTEGQVWTGTFRYRAAPGLAFKLSLD
ncbi:hypothetical protein ScPMuIL_007936 [Solemya velum]